jgi:glycosyltransferase 2 family protein
MKNHYRWLAYSIVLTVIAFAVWIGYKDQEKIFSAISQVGWGGVIFLCLFSSFNYALRFLRWNYLLKQLGDRVGLWEGLMCYLSGFALTTTPAKAGEVVRCFYFGRRHGVEYSHTLACLLIERTMDALSAVLIGSLALYTFEKVRWIGVAFTLCIIVVVVLVSHQKMLLWSVNLFRFVKVNVVQRLLDLVPAFLARTANLFQPRPFTAGVLVALIAWAAEGFAFAWLAHELGGQGSTLLYISIFSVAVVAGALTFVPGGLGGTEVVLYMLTVATGMGDAEALTATLLIRLTTLWYAVILGSISLLWLESNDLRYAAGNAKVMPE